MQNKHQGHRLQMDLCLVSNTAYDTQHRVKVKWRVQKPDGPWDDSLHSWILRTHSFLFCPWSNIKQPAVVFEPVCNFTLVKKLRDIHFGKNFAVKLFLVHFQKISHPLTVLLIPAGARSLSAVQRETEWIPGLGLSRFRLFFFFSSLFLRPWKSCWTVCTDCQSGFWIWWQLVWSLDRSVPANSNLRTK